MVQKPWAGAGGSPSTWKSLQTWMPWLRTGEAQDHSS